MEMCYFPSKMYMRTCEKVLTPMHSRLLHTAEINPLQVFLLLNSPVNSIHLPFLEVCLELFSYVALGF